MLEPAKPNVLLVDHDAKSRRCMEVSLRRAGFCVLSATDHLDATEKLHMMPPQLVLTEFQGPQVDGVQFCKSIRENPRMAGVPVVFLTKETGSNGKQLATRAGATDYIVKPTFIDDIISRVHHLVGDLDNHARGTQPGYRTKPHGYTLGRMHRPALRCHSQCQNIQRHTGTSHHSQRACN